MAEIKHVIGIRAPIAAVFAALTTNEGLSKWWTMETTGVSGEKGGVIAFRFGADGPDMEVIDIVPNTRVEWVCGGHLAGMTDWTGTHVSFDLVEKDGKVMVRFGHTAWKDGADFLPHCSMKWATFLLSLRESLETGVGRPFPHDLQIS